MKHRLILFTCTAGWMFACPVTSAETIAYWRFEGDGVSVPAEGTLVAHTSGRTTYPATSGILVVDESGNGNHLYGWSDSRGLRYTRMVSAPWTGTATNELSVVNQGGAPRAFTWGTQSHPSGVNLDTWQPLEWTIEASVYLDPSAASGWRTFIGRDGYGMVNGQREAACLYFQKSDRGHLRLTFTDALWNQNTLEDSEFFVAGRWYHVAAVSDGVEARLYKWDTVVDAGYRLVASTDLISWTYLGRSLAADTMDGSSLPLDAVGDPMNWSVGSGMWDSRGQPEFGHVDWWIGMIDEVRISNVALDPAEFLFASPLSIAEATMEPEGEHADRIRLEWNSTTGATYRVTATTNLGAREWTPQETGIPATPPLNVWTSEVQTAQQSFFRVEKEAARLMLRIHPHQVLNSVDERIYGHFLEHIYHSVNGGLWGELVWDRSFENELTSDLNPADHRWHGYGPSSVSQSADAANSYASYQVTKLDAAEGGLHQTPFRLDVQPYTGSVWAKGTSITGMVVRLKDFRTVLAETNFPGLSDSWQKYSFRLTPSTPTVNGTLEIGFPGNGVAHLDQVSLMGQDSIDTGGYRPDLLAAAEELRPRVIRWPGGCFASAYRWKYGIGPQDERIVHPIVQWDDQDVNSFGTDEFIQMCQRIGAEPILVINMGQGAAGGLGADQDPYPTFPELLQDALDWIEYCNGDTNTTWGAVRAANGHPEPYQVKYWELDNETWDTFLNWYPVRVNQFAPLMRAKDPSIKLIVVGSGGFDQSWNQKIISSCATNIDYISLHNYWRARDYASGPLAYEDFLLELADYIAASDNPNIEIYVSEWNAQCVDLRTGLFAGGLLNVFERQGATLTMSGPALMYRHLSARDWNNAFINFDHTGSFVAPNYVVMKLWRDHYEPWRILLGGDAGPLNVVATKSEDGGTVQVKVVNPGSTVHAAFTLPEGTAIDGATLHYVTAPSWSTENSLAAPDAVRVATGSALFFGSVVEVTFPALSASVVSINIR